MLSASRNKVASVGNMWVGLASYWGCRLADCDALGISCQYSTGRGWIVLEIRLGYQS